MGNQNQNPNQNKQQTTQVVTPTASVVDSTPSPSVESPKFSAETYEGGAGERVTFQSEEAAVAVKRPAQRVEETPQLAEVSSAEPEDVELTPSDRAHYEKLVTIRPRKTINNMRYGPKWYQFTEGKKTLVPRHLAQLLEEKGII